MNCPKCKSPIGWYRRRDYGIDDEGQRYYEMEDYQACTDVECDYEL